MDYYGVIEQGTQRSVVVTIRPGFEVTWVRNLASGSILYLGNQIFVGDPRCDALPMEPVWTCESP